MKLLIIRAMKIRVVITTTTKLLPISVNIKVSAKSNRYPQHPFKLMGSLLIGYLFILNSEMI